MDDIPDILSNHFEGLSTPVAVHIGFAKRDKTYSDEELENLKKKLQLANIKTTLYNSPEATSPDTTILTPSGIRSPVLTPEDACAFAKDIEKATENNPPLAYAYPVDINQLPPCSKKVLTDDDKKFIENLLKDYAYKAGAYPYEAYIYDSRKTYEHRTEHPEISLSDDIGYEAFKKREQLRKQYIQKFEDFTSKCHDAVYHGSLRVNPYEIITNKENKTVVYGTSQTFNAIKYSTALCGDGENLKEEKTLSIPNESRATFGFLHIHQKAPHQSYYFDFGMEERKIPHELEDLYSHNNETPILKHKNKHIGTFLIISQENRKIPIPIDLNAPEWQRYQALTTPYLPDYSLYLAQRLETQRLKIKENPNYAETYKKEKSKLQTSIYTLYKKLRTRL
jgi:hypothetical protein